MPFKITIEAPDESTLRNATQVVDLIQGLMTKLDRQPHKSPLKWSAPHVAFVELIYALHASEVFNNGSTDIRQIAETLQQAFNISIPNVYRTFQTILERKTNPTPFMDDLKKKLESHIHEMSV